MTDLTPADFAEQERRLAYIGKAAKSVARKGADAGAKLLQKKLQDASPVAKRSRKVRGRIIQPGAMKRSIGWSRLKLSGDLTGAKTGFDVGQKNRTDESGSHGHLFVQGTADRWSGFVRIRSRGKTTGLKRTKNQIRYRGSAPAHKPSFIQATTSSAKTDVESAIFAAVNAGIEKAARDQGL